VRKKRGFRSGARAFCPPLQLPANVTRTAGRHCNLHAVALALVFNLGRAGGNTFQPPALRSRLDCYTDQVSMACWCILRLGTCFSGNAERQTVIPFLRIRWRVPANKGATQATIRPYGFAGRHRYMEAVKGQSTNLVHFCRRFDDFYKLSRPFRAPGGSIIAPRGLLAFR